MAEYAYLISRSSKTLLALGKAVKKADGKVNYFSREDGKGGRNSENALLTKALWKFIAEHGYDGVEVVSDDDPDFETIAQYRQTGGDTMDDITLEQYLEGWPG
ncbi:hypothetical protein [Nocardia terpenica]|uniref:Uncharacterized protein n=1 Tax=Nocardia terpenica TaxID=455432 RepID=A0A164HII4_9NOCA|nr:hypothetical protein [Nocardia terpenica]KZM68545.1 hypothetical protein AWN90_11825 [Nocardia terpenica]NQE88495.1 hypothetical protein [Nocardia terpenica]